MKSKSGWLLLSGIVVLALVLAGCPATPTTTPPTTTPPTTTPPTTTPPTTTPSAAEPVYGGTTVYIEGVAISGFDECYTPPWAVRAAYPVTEELIIGDWAKGPAGTNQTAWTMGGWPPEHLRYPNLCESYEVSGTDIIWTIRQGVHWHNKAPVNGREMTAEDVAYTLQRMIDCPQAYVGGAMRSSIDSIEVDGWNVIAHLNSPGAVGRGLNLLSDMMMIVPREVIDTYGDMRDWRNLVGTGPFELVDYVADSSLTYEANPNYWREDSLHPGNQLPYVDTLKSLIITDISTRITAFRTKKADSLTFLDWESADVLLKEFPGDIEYVTSWGGDQYLIGWRLDKTELPFSDINVRRAMMMAIDFEEIVDDLYGGYAAMISYPVPPWTDFDAARVPLDELPAETQELWSYNPTKAQQLLADAGYTSGFTTSLTTRSDHYDYINVDPVLISYWADIGITVDLDVREYGTYVSMWNSFEYPEMLHGIYYSPSATALLANKAPELGGTQNFGHVVDPISDDAYARISDPSSDDLNDMAIMKEITPHLYEQVYYIPMPAAAIFNMWWPWLKGYHGETSPGFLNSGPAYATYIWIDQDLKEAMK